MLLAKLAAAVGYDGSNSTDLSYAAIASSSAPRYEKRSIVIPKLGIIGSKLELFTEIFVRTARHRN